MAEHMNVWLISPVDSGCVYVITPTDALKVLSCYIQKTDNEGQQQALI